MTDKYSNESTHNIMRYNVESLMSKIARKKFLSRVTQRKERDILFCYGPNMRKSSISNVLGYNILTTKAQDAYFYLSEASKEEDVTYTTCNYVDLDAGRDSKMKYLSDSKVATHKLKMVDLINNSPLKPHYIVETRNGYQCYWLTNKTEYKSTNSKCMWKMTQLYIREYFKEYADKRVAKVNQIMRLPNTIWYKPEERKSPVFCSLQDLTGTSLRRYNKSLVYNKFKSLSSSTEKIDVDDLSRKLNTGSYIFPQQDNEVITSSPINLLNTEIPVPAISPLSQKLFHDKQKHVNVQHEIAIKLIKVALKYLESE